MPPYGPRARAHCELLGMVADVWGARDPETALQRLGHPLTHIASLREVDRASLL